MVADLRGNGLLSAQDIRLIAEFVSSGHDKNKQFMGKFGTNTNIVKYQASYLMFLNNSFQKILILILSKPWEIMKFLSDSTNIRSEP